MPHGYCRNAVTVLAEHHFFNFFGTGFQPPVSAMTIKWKYSTYA